MISVVICTYNRADLLAGALQSVCRQTLSHAEYEVIVVDNNSTDNTGDIVRSFAADYANVHYCLEPRQGLSHARNRGWREARGEVVAYIDDDIEVPPEWLVVAGEVIGDHSPDVLSGPSFAFYNTVKPGWFKDAYGSHEPYSQAGVAARPEDLYGHNLLFKRELLAQSGGFDPTLGMVGDRIAYGEETALLRHIHATMPEKILYYEPRLYVYHLVRPEKMVWRWLIKDRFAKGRYAHRIFQAGKINSLVVISRMLRISVRLLLDVMVGAQFRQRDKQPWRQQYFYESSLRYIQSLGSLYEQFRQSSVGNLPTR